AGCGVPNPPVIYDPCNQDGSSSLSQQFVQLKADGVTSMLYYPCADVDAPYAPQAVASSINYNPEWVVMGWSELYVSTMVYAGSPSELGASFGVAPWNKLGPRNSMPWFQSYTAGGGAWPPHGTSYALDLVDGQ